MSWIRPDGNKTPLAVRASGLAGLVSSRPARRGTWATRCLDPAGARDPQPRLLCLGDGEWHHSVRHRSARLPAALPGSAVLACICRSLRVPTKAIACFAVMAGTDMVAIRPSMAGHSLVARPWRGPLASVRSCPRAGLGDRGQSGAPCLADSTALGLSRLSPPSRSRSLPPPIPATRTCQRYPDRDLGAHGIDSRRGTDGPSSSPSSRTTLDLAHAAWSRRLFWSRSLYSFAGVSENSPETCLPVCTLRTRA